MALREAKKEETRQQLADAAWRLFTERGFDRVSVAEVARAAGVSEKTAFNYFATKEDLFFSRLEAFGGELVDAVRSRQADESALDALRAVLLEPRGLLAAIDAGSAEAAA